MKKLYPLFIVPLLMFAFSCSAKINGSLLNDGAAEMVFEAHLAPRTITVVGSLRSFMGEDPNAPILDGPAMTQSLSSSQGIKSASIKNTSPSSIDGSISISNVDYFLSSPLAKGRFITFTEGQEPGSSSIVIVLDRDSTPELISNLSPEANDYLSALFVPVILGETSTRSEYLTLVSLVYGRAFSDEIAASRIHAIIEFPRPITSIQGGAASGRNAEFDIALVDLLVLEKPMRYEVKW